MSIYTCMLSVSDMASLTDNFSLVSSKNYITASFRSMEHGKKTVKRCTWWYSEADENIPTWHSCNNVGPMHKPLDTSRFNSLHV